MLNLKIFCHLAPEIALKAGIPRAGDFEIRLEPEHVAELTAQRMVDAAARYVALTEERLPGGRLVVLGDTFEHVVRALAVLVDQEKRADRVASGNRRAELALLAAYGEKHQRDRYAAGALPEDELLALARKVAFLTFEGCLKFARLEAGDVKHKPGCANGVNGGIAFATIDGAQLDRYQWEIYQRLEAAGGRALRSWGELAPAFTSPAIKLHTHTGKCLGCDKATTRPSAKVSVSWAGRTLVREYDLRSDRVSP